MSQRQGNRNHRLAGLVLPVLVGIFVGAGGVFAGTIVSSETVSVTAVVTVYNPGTGGTGGSGSSGGSGGGAGFILFPIIIDPPSFLPEFTLDPNPRVCNRIADYNCDGLVNIVDFSILIYWFNRAPVPEAIDLTGDGAVNLRDFSVMAYYWYDE
jgi:hypothetical protein